MINCTFLVQRIYGYNPITEQEVDFRDEKAIAVVKETKTRAKAVKRELADVVDAAKGKKKKNDHSDVECEEKK